jgi:benzil reductase ((S)-benzoin forming)
MKTAVVTGASYGIGSEITKALLKLDWKVYGLSRSKPNFTGHKFVWLQCNLDNANQLEKSLAAITEPVLDVLISNAGVVIDEAATSVSSASFEKTFSVNVLAPMLIIAGLRDKIRRSTIISVSSVSDRLPDANMALYCSSKAANTLYFDVLAKELKTAKIYTLLPDYVDTPMLRNFPPSDKDFNWDVIIQPSDIAKLTLDLITETIVVESGANIIVVTEALKASWNSTEKLYGFNTESGKLVKLAQ